MGKNSVESSLKRFLKRRVKITLGFVVAFMIMGTGIFAQEIESPIAANNGNTISIDDEVFNIEANVDMGGATYILEATSKGMIDINSKEIRIKSSSNAQNVYGMVAQQGGILNIGDKNTENIFINATGTDTSDYVLGIYLNRGEAYKDGGEKVYSGGFANITGKNVVIQATGVDDSLVAGVYCITAGIGKNDTYNSKINFNTDNLVITATGGRSAGIIAWSKGEVLMNKGNVTITADDAIHARWAKVQINANNNSENTVKLNGDIKFEYSGESGTDVNSDIIVNLSNSNSEFTGKIYTYLKSGNPTVENLKYNKMKLGIANGATWNVTGDSLVNNLTLDGGVINILNTKETGNETNSGELDDYTGINDSQTVLNVDNLSGNGGTVTFETEIDGNKVDVANGTLKIKNDVTDETNLKVGFSNIDSDELIQNNVNLQEAFKQLSNKVTDKNGNKIDEIEETYFAESGELHGEITAVEDGKGGFVINTEKDSDVVKGLRDLATINLLTWRQEMNSLNKRMGELRNSTGEHGVWSRVYTGKIENGERYDNDYQTYQVGYDKKYSVDNGIMFIGGLVSYSKGETNYELGTGENYSVGAGIYATWLNNDGYFADMVLKQSRLHNKFDVMNKGGKYKQSGDYNNWGTSLSGQYGKRFDVNDKLFIEPSAELTLGRVEDTTYITSEGVNVHQDTMYSLVGNVGTAVGYKFNDKGNIYTRVSLVREFQGDIDTYYEHNSATNETHEDLADTWVEFGIGANYRFAEDLNVYVDLQKTGEATVDTEWQTNLGFRYEF